MRENLLKFLTALIISAALISCGSSRPSYKASEIPEAAATQSADYAIGPGDSLQIFVWDHAGPVNERTGASRRQNIDAAG